MLRRPEAPTGSTPAGILTPKRLRLYPVAMLIGVAIGYAVFVATSDGLRTSGGGRMGGDFPAFYGAGLIARAGDDLYDRAAQKRVQAEYLPDDPGGWIDFAYPPYVAAAYVPFTLLPFKQAYLLHTLLAAGCTVLAVWLLAQSLPIDRRDLLPCIATALTFYPLFRAVVGGQNTPISLLCAAGAIHSLVRGRDLGAGLWIGAWLFKPQIALTVGVLAVLGGHVRVLPGLAIWAAAYYGLGNAIAGPAWPLTWWKEGVVPFTAADVVVDRGNGVSFIQMASEHGAPEIGWAAAILLGAMVAATLWKKQTHPGLLIAIASVSAVLCAPHALFYDGGLALLAMAAAASILGERALPGAISLWVAAAALPLLLMPGLPAMLVLVGSLALAGYALPGSSKQPGDLNGALVEQQGGQVRRLLRS